MKDFVKHRGKRFILLGIVLLGLFATGLLFVVARNWEEKLFAAQFAREAQDHVAAVQMVMKNDVEVLYSLGDLYRSSRLVEEQEFDSFVEAPLSKHPEIVAFYWSPRKEAEQFPVLYEESLRDQSKVHGFDFGSDSQLKMGMLSARDLGEAIAVPSPRLPWKSTTPENSLVAFLPVYRNDVPIRSIEERRQNLLGFVTAQFDLSEIFHQAASPGDLSLVHLQLIDTTSPGNRMLLYPPISEKVSSSLRWERSFQIMGRQWTIEAVPTSLYFGMNRHWSSWIILSGGLLFTLLGSLYANSYMTKVHQREEEAVQVQQTQKMEAIGRLADKVASEFQRILSVVSSYQEQKLVEPTQTDSTPQRFEEIGNTINQASTLTRQLLVLSRKQEGTKSEQVDLQQAVKSMQEVLHLTVGSNIKIETHFDPEEALVNIDPEQVNQVVMNLVINAREAMPAGGKISIETACQDRWVVLTVSDTGGGMDATTRAKIFEPFFTTKQGQGTSTGLGLSIVYGIVQQNGGRIEVESEVGKGSRFKIYLPRMAESTFKRTGLVGLRAVK